MQNKDIIYMLIPYKLIKNIGCLMEADKKGYTSSEIQKIYRFSENEKTLTQLYYAEETSQIPTSVRINRGKVPVRYWSQETLSKIGSKFGFLKQTKEAHIFCVYFAKGGGNIKSSWAMNFLRTMAINGVSKKNGTGKILAIPLDTQQSLTDYLLGKPEIESLKDIKQTKGLYELLYDNEPLENIIKPTDLPNLFIIPESVSLSLLEKKIRFETKKEDFFNKRLLPLLKDFDYIVFDNSPSWSSLQECSLACSDNVIAPVGLDFGGFNALSVNNENIREFQDAMGLSWDNYIIQPVMLQKTKLSAQILSSYMTQYPDEVIEVPIRASIIGQESLVMKKSVIEYAPNSPLADDYYESIKLVWDKVLKAEALNVVEA
jgi:chromosome partitioning protein